MVYSTVPNKRPLPVYFFLEIAYSFFRKIYNRVKVKYCDLRKISIGFVKIDMKYAKYLPNI